MFVSSQVVLEICPFLPERKPGENYSTGLACLSCDILFKTFHAHVFPLLADTLQDVAKLVF